MHKTILKHTLSACELGSMLVSLLLAVVFLYGCDKAVGQAQPRDFVTISPSQPALH